MLRWQDPDGRTHTWPMPKSLLYGDGAALCAALADQGLGLAPGTKARNLLLGYLAAASPSARITCVPRCGWHEMEGHCIFVLPDRTIGSVAGGAVVLQAPTTICSPFAVRGTLSEWQEQLTRHCEGNARLVFVVAAALASPLLHLIGAEGGGFHLHGSSSQGKTTLLQVAASVWGCGDRTGYVGTWRATANGLEGVAALHSDALLVLDELGQAEARAVAEAGYMLAQGIGKARAGRTGEARAPARWRTLILSSGEVPVTTKTAEERRRRAAAGQMVRLIDVPSDAGRGLGAFDQIPAEFADSKAFTDTTSRPRRFPSTEQPGLR